MYSVESIYCEVNWQIIEDPKIMAKKIKANSKGND